MSGSDVASEIAFVTNAAEIANGRSSVTSGRQTKLLAVIEISKLPFEGLGDSLKRKAIK